MSDERLDVATVSRPVADRAPDAGPAVHRVDGDRASIAARVVGRFGRSIPRIYFTIGGLVVVSTIVAPASLNAVSLRAMLPFAAFLAIAALGQSLVVLHGGIDLSVPAVMTMVGIMLLDVSRGRDGRLGLAIGVTLSLSAGIGLLTGALIAKARVTPLVTTLAMGSLVTGATFWYRGRLQAESTVPPALARWGSHKVLGNAFLGYPVLIAVTVAALLTTALRYTTAGRTFVLVGASARAAWVAGVPIARYQIAAYTIAAFLYGVAGLVLAAFIRNPGDHLGAPYLLPPIVAVVIGGVAFGGGTGSFVGVLGGALFVTQLEQVLRVAGLSTGAQSVLLGVVILVAVADRRAAFAAVRHRLAGLAPWRRPPDP